MQIFATNMQVLLAIWVTVLAAYGTVTVMRWTTGKHEDDNIHVMDTEQRLVAAQISVAHRMDVLDRWSTALLVLVVLFGLLIVAAQVWSVWVTSATQPIFS